MKQETTEHVHMLIRVFKFIVLPASLLYVFANLLLLKQNAFDSMVLGILVFFYSSFLPDLTCIFRREKDKARTKCLSGYKKYALLLFAPLFICILFSNVPFIWKTAEDFHNFRSLTVYNGFLLLMGFVIFGGLPVSPGQVTETLALPLYGTIGYITHLKVDEML